MELRGFPVDNFASCVRSPFPVHFRCGAGREAGGAPAKTDRVDASIPGGRRGPGDVLCMAALSATIHNAEMKALCGRLRERGGHRKVALAGVMRKLVVTANVLPRDRRMRERRMDDSAA